MMLVTGPAFAGKKTFVCDRFGWTMEELAASAVTDAARLIEEGKDLSALADELAARPVVIISETGAGVVPADPAQRLEREQSGRLACLLGERADTVVRMCCGIPQVLKGAL